MNELRELIESSKQSNHNKHSPINFNKQIK